MIFTLTNQNNTLLMCLLNIQSKFSYMIEVPILRSCERSENLVGKNTVPLFSLTFKWNAAFLSITSVDNKPQ